MKAALLVGPRRIEVREIPDPTPGPLDVVVEVEAVGVCGSDIHIHAGHINWNLDPAGTEVPLSRSPQILGHEICGRVVEMGEQVTGIEVGERVVVDQGINCSSRGFHRKDWCEYCASGFSHHCAAYVEHGITGLPGGFADRILIPAVNVIPVEKDLPAEKAAMTEPLGCVLHSLRLVGTLGGRHQFKSNDPSRRIRTIALAGLGPSGQLFGQALRRIVGFDGPIIAGDPDPTKRERAERDFDAITVDPADSTAMIDAVRQSSKDRGVEMIIDACGAPSAWREFPALLRKQGTAVLYGFGRERGSGGTLDALQWRGAHLIASSGASGAIDEDGRPTLYRESLRHITEGTIRMDDLVTHHYRGLEDLDRALGVDPGTDGYLKGVLHRDA